MATMDLWNWNGWKENLNRLCLLQRQQRDAHCGDEDVKSTSMIILPYNIRTVPFIIPGLAAGVTTRGFQRSTGSLNVETSTDYGQENEKGISGAEIEQNTLRNNIRQISRETVRTLSDPTINRVRQRRSSDVGHFGGFRGVNTLGSIDPSLYKAPTDDEDYDLPRGHIGRIWVGLHYEQETEKLTVTLLKAKNLPSRSFYNPNECDPFVRIFLIPDDRRYLQSKFKKKTCHPKFDESFVFQISEKSLSERLLKFTVYDVDRHKRHIVIGHAIYLLKDLMYDRCKRAVIGRDLEKEVSECACDKGEILISLCLNDHLGRLALGVLEAKNIKAAKGTSQKDFYVKVSLLLNGKAVKTKRTETVKRTSNPTFNESFTFNLPANDVAGASVTITCMQYLTGHIDKMVGMVVLGSFMFARGKELEHWNSMVANQREQINLWHPLT